MLHFSELSQRNKGRSFHNSTFFINAFTLSPLNGVSSRVFLNHINKSNCLMPSNTFRQILLNKTSSRLQTTSLKIKANATVISHMRRTIFQSLKVLHFVINHKMSYIVNLWYLCKLILCWIETPISIKILIKWWLPFDVIGGSCFFSAWNLYHIFIGVWCMRKMKDLQTKSHAYYLSITYNACQFCLLTPPANLALAKCLFIGWRLYIRVFFY